MPADTPRRRLSEPAANDQSLLPVGVVARHLETSTARLRAWERRYGLGPSARTAGGHRRYSMQDLERLRQMCTLVRGGVPAAQAAQVVQNAPNGPAVGAPRAFREPVTAAELTQAMHALDTAAVTRMVSAALSDRGAVPAWTHIFEPVLTSMGTHWERTGCGVEAEHVTSGLMEAGLRSHADGCAGRRSPRAPILLAATPGERHVLPLAALAAALAECGQTSVLSSDLPARALRDAITRIRPAAVVLWARTTGFADPQCL